MNEFIPNFRDRQVTSAVKKLIVFSLSIIGLPLSSMFVSKRFLFEGYLGYSSSDSITYAAIIAVVLVHVVLAAFVYTAWNEPELVVPTTPAGAARTPGRKDKKKD